MADFKELMDCIKESEQRFNDAKRKYERISSDIKKIKTEIEISEDKIKECEKELSSAEIVKEDIIRSIEEESTNEIKKCENSLDSKNRDLKESHKSFYRNKKREIEEKYDLLNKENDESYVEVSNKLKDKVERHKETLKIKENLEEKILESEKEENKIRLLVPTIKEEYTKARDNIEYKADERNPKGATPKEAELKYSSISDNALIEIASKMNNGVYYSSPDESAGIPVLEIFMNTLSLIGMLLKGGWSAILTILKGMFAPLTSIKSEKNKAIYTLIVVGILGFTLYFILFKAIGIIFNIILFLIGIGVLIFGIMIIYNFLKFGNKKIRKELNIGYYTVGYYLNHREDEILFRLARNRYNYLKTNKPSELEEIINKGFGSLKESMEKINALAENQEKIVAEARINFADFQVKFGELKINLQSELENELKRVFEENELTEKKELEEEKRKKEEEIAKIEDNKMKKLGNLDEEVKERNRRNKEKINNLRRDISTYEDKLDSLNESLKKEEGDLIKAEKDNRKFVEDINTADIDPIAEREVNDKIPKRLFLGVENDKDDITIDNRLHYVQRECVIKNENKPIFMIFKDAQEESNDVSKRYYQTINNMIIDFLSKTYFGAFQFVLVDNKLNKSRIKTFMPTISSAFEDFIKAEVIDVQNDNLDKVLSKLKARREEELNGKSMHDVNESNKGMDKMVRQILLFVRVYGENGKTLEMKNLNQLFGGLVSTGILPVFFMKEDFYESNRDYIELFVNNEQIEKIYELNVSNQNDYLISERK